MMKWVSAAPLLVLVGVWTVASPPPSREDQRPGFSAGALQYLLDKEEYGRFDWYVERYRSRHPDSTILDILSARRFFAEASLQPHRHTFFVEDPTGGIPRRYPAPFPAPVQRGFLCNRHHYDSELMNRAFASLRSVTAREPQRGDLMLELCIMGAQANIPQLFAWDLEQYLERFGCDTAVVGVAVRYLHSVAGCGGERDRVAILEPLVGVCGKETLRGELARLYLALGEVDSAWNVVRAVRTDSIPDPALLRVALGIAALRRDYPGALALSLRSWELGGDPAALEQAAAFASLFDSTQALRLWERVHSDPSFCDTLSLARRFFPADSGSVGIENGLFTDSLWYLNYPLVDRDFILRQDTVAYYHYQAASYYLAARYDSAAWYNLRLLRILRESEGLGVDALFNLAAEHFASGNHLMSYLRFLDLYRFFGGEHDPQVRYGLGVNYEQFGDYGRARPHYQFVVTAPTASGALREQALWRLQNLGRAQGSAIR